MNEILTIVEHDKICISDKRDIENRIISYRDSKLLLEITHKTKSGKVVKVFTSLGGYIKANSIVGSISLKSGLIVEILPKFAKSDLKDESKKIYRKTLLNMIRVSKEKKSYKFYKLKAQKFLWRGWLLIRIYDGAVSESLSVELEK